MTLRILLIAGLFAAAGLAGCGSEQKPTAPARLRPDQTDTPRPVSVRAGRAARAALADLDDRPALQPHAFSVPIDPDAASDDMFVIDDQPNFEILAAGGPANPADIFSVRVPEQGHNSSTFLVIDAPPAPRPGQPDRGFTLPDGFEAVASAGYSDTGLPLRVRSVRDEAEMALVPAGVSLVGTKSGDGPSEASPQFSVHLDTFYIDVAEVTLAQYDRYMAERRTQVARPLQEPLNRGAPRDHPALGLSWGAARDFALWAGKELPTEAQWEKAARGPTGFDYPWGGGRAVFARARTRSQIDPVGSFPLDRSPYGLLDVAGNAREWCLDFYSDRAFQEAAGGGDATLSNWEGPRRPSAESQRVVKGNGPDWKLWHRAGLSMREQRPDVGFRCVLRLKPADAAAAEATAGSSTERNADRNTGSPSRRPRVR
ncbi:MAG TPA: formylglycine-generating enzyme family protein [Planctomycetaceae bacterium]|nr:formylglycine-generating enzyme family protein [Planctomycetaceae bacterium]